MIQFQSVHKAYRVAGREIPALQPTTLQIGSGQVFGIIGHSGAGKSTLLRLINRLEEPSGGRIEIDGADVTALDATGLRRFRQQVGMIFQHFNLLSSKTVADNIAMPLRLAGELSRAEIDARVAELLARVGLQDHANKYPAQLSGGQKQRVGIARALADDPAVLLCDEPTSALDPETTRSILDLIKNVRDTLGLTVIIITHEMSVVRQVCDSVSLLEAGKIVESGRLEDIVLDVDSRLSREIVPFPKVPEAAVAHGESVIDVSITAHPGQPAAVALMSMVAELGGDIAAGVFETIGQAQIGRLAVTVPASDTEQAVSTLRKAGIAAEVRS